MVTLKENALDLEVYLMLRKAVGWKLLSNEQAKKALDNSLYNVVAYVDDKPVAMGRIVGDGAVICYVQDLIVLPEYQKLKIGSQIMNKLEEYVTSIKEPDTEMMFCLMCAKGREKFDIVILDPPYSMKIIPEILDSIVKFGLIAPKGKIVCESEDDVEYTHPELETVKHNKYGRVYITVLCKKGDEE